MEVSISRISTAPLKIARSSKEIDWSSLEIEDSLASFFSCLVDQPVEKLLGNAAAQFVLLEFAKTVFPICLPEAAKRNSYVVSPSSQSFIYPRDELRIIPNRLVRSLSSAAFRALEKFAGAAQMDRSALINSSLLSTSLYKKFSLEDLEALVEYLRFNFRDRALIFKNLTLREHPEFIQRLKNLGFDLMLTRQVYFFDGEKATYWKKSSLKRDRSTLKKSIYRWDGHDSLESRDCERILELYRKLYIEKHNLLNPQYTRYFVEQALANRWFEFEVLRHPSGRIDAFVGYYDRASISSAPFIGYETDLPAKIGLYRMMVLRILERTEQKSLLLNYSSGAGEFKRRRGGEPELDYSAVFTKHLPNKRQSRWKKLIALYNYGAHYAFKNYDI